jgi:putative glutathione S-transferase
MRVPLEDFQASCPPRRKMMCPDTLDSKDRWNRIPSNFRNTIPSERFPAEEGRYILYFNCVCPWAHRAVIIRALKGLNDIIHAVEVDAKDPFHGWYFSGNRGPDRDPIYGVKWLKELYLKADPNYSGRVRLPLLWDMKQGTPSKEAVSSPC